MFMKHGLQNKSLGEGYNKSTKLFVLFNQTKLDLRRKSVEYHDTGLCSGETFIRWLYSIETKIDPSKGLWKIAQKIPKISLVQGSNWLMETTTKNNEQQQATKTILTKNTLSITN